MSKKDGSRQGLFNIGEVVKACGVTRKTILFYERRGLLEPAYVDPKSGYRYYDIDCIVYTLLQIVQFRDAGLSIAEISDYFSGGQAAAERIAASLETRLNAMRKSLDNVRTFAVQSGNLSVRQAMLPAAYCYVREYLCHSIKDAQDGIINACDRALREGFCLRNSYDSFAQYEFDFYSEKPLALDEFKTRFCIPVATGIRHPDCISFPASPAICVTYRGDYDGIGRAYEALGEYVREKRLVPSGPVREYYLDGGRGYAESAQRYVTRVMLPVEASTPVVTVL